MTIIVLYLLIFFKINVKQIKLCIARFRDKYKEKCKISKLFFRYPKYPNFLVEILKILDQYCTILTSNNNFM